MELLAEFEKAGVKITKADYNEWKDAAKIILWGSWVNSGLMVFMKEFQKIMNGK